jgi:hypothetical protein
MLNEKIIHTFKLLDAVAALVAKIDVISTSASLSAARRRRHVP